MLNAKPLGTIVKLDTHDILFYAWGDLIGQLRYMDRFDWSVELQQTKINYGWQ